MSGKVEQIYEPSHNICLKCSYYKHHINVTKAVKALKEKGINIKLNLTGANVTYHLVPIIQSKMVIEDYVRSTKIMNVTKLLMN